MVEQTLIGNISQSWGRVYKATYDIQTCKSSTYSSCFWWKFLWQYRR